jgi:hypothetical protein
MSSLALALAAALVTAPAAAGSLVIADDASGLRLRLDVPGAEVCAGYPARLRNQADCPSLPLPPIDGVARAFGTMDAAARNNGARVIALAYVIHENYGYSVVVTHAGRSRGVEFSPAEIADLVRGVRQGAAGRLRAGVTLVGPMADATHDVLTIRGTQAVRQVLALAVPEALREDQPNRMLFYHLIGQRGAVSVAFVTDDAALARARAEIDALAAQATVPPATSRAAMARRMAVVLGVVLGVLVTVVAAVVLAIVLATRARRTHVSAAAPWASHGVAPPAPSDSHPPPAA